MTQTILLITLFFTSGQVTSQTLPAPSMEECETARSSIAVQLNGTKYTLADGKEVTVKYADIFCHLAVEGKNA